MKYTALLLFLAGCAQQLTLEERELKYEQLRYDTVICKAIYKKSSAIWVSHFHETKHRPLNYTEARFDFTFNKCGAIVTRVCKRDTPFPVC